MSDEQLPTLTSSTRVSPESELLILLFAFAGTILKATRLTVGGRASELSDTLLSVVHLALVVALPEAVRL
jgi:hypothetical protein